MTVLLDVAERRRRTRVARYVSRGTPCYLACETCCNSGRGGGWGEWLAETAFRECCTCFAYRDDAYNYERIGEQAIAFCSHTKWWRWRSSSTATREWVSYCLFRNSRSHPLLTSHTSQASRTGFVLKHAQTGNNPPSPFRRSMDVLPLQVLTFASLSIVCCLL